MLETPNQADRHPDTDAMENQSRRPSLLEIVIVALIALFTFVIIVWTYYTIISEFKNLAAPG